MSPKRILDAAMGSLQYHRMCHCTPFDCYMFCVKVPLIVSYMFCINSMMLCVVHHLPYILSFVFCWGTPMLPRGCHLLGPWAASGDNDGDNDICNDHNDADML